MRSNLEIIIVFLEEESCVGKRRLNVITAIGLV